MSALQGDLVPIADVGLATLHLTVGGAVNITGMVVRGRPMGPAIAGMGVGMNVRLAVPVAMDMDVNPLADQAVEDVRPQQDQHDPHGKLQSLGQRRAHGAF